MLSNRQDPGGRTILPRQGAGSRVLNTVYNRIRNMRITIEYTRPVAQSRRGMLRIAQCSLALSLLPGKVLEAKLAQKLAPYRD